MKRDLVYVWIVQHYALPLLIPLLPQTFLAKLSPTNLQHALQLILACYIMTNGQQCPQPIQLEAVLGLWTGENILVKAGTGASKTLIALLQHLLDDSD